MKISNSQQLIDLYLLAAKGLDKFTVRPGWQYPEAVHNFIDEIAQSDWLDCNYNAGRELQKFRNAEYMKKATEAEVCSILTAFSRGERFCVGFIGSSFHKGYVKNTIERLARIHHLTNM